MALKPFQKQQMLKTKGNSIIFGGCWAYKSGLCFWIRALKVPFLGTCKCQKCRISTDHQHKWLQQYRFWALQTTFSPVDKVQLIFDPGFCAALTKVLLMIIELGEAIV